MKFPNTFPVDPFGPPVRRLSVSEYWDWLENYAWPQVAHLDLDSEEHWFAGKPFTFFPEEADSKKP
jgi:hypothetical protein